MYPQVDVEKRIPDGSVWQRFRAYRLPDEDGVVRLYRPAGTPWWNPMGGWVQEHPGVSAFPVERPFVVHCHGPAGAKRFYVDIISSSTVGTLTVTYADLFLDVMIDPEGVVTEKDEHQLAVLDAREQAFARAARDEVRRLIAAGDALFDPLGRYLRIPADAADLPALEVSPA